MADAARAATRLAVSDFALVRQSRWREAIASIFDDPDFLPYLRSLRRIAVTYATHDETGAPGSTNLVKPVYHVGWLASRLDLTVVKPLAAVAGRADRERRRPRRGPGAGRPSAAGWPRRCRTAGPRSPSSSGRSSRRCRPARRCGSSCSPSGAAPSCGPTSPPRPRRSTSASGRTASRRSTGASSRARRGDVDLLAEAIEAGRRDPVAIGALARLARRPLDRRAATATVGDR